MPKRKSYRFLTIYFGSGDLYHRLVEKCNHMNTSVARYVRQAIEEKLHNKTTIRPNEINGEKIIKVDQPQKLSSSPTRKPIFRILS